MVRVLTCALVLSTWVTALQPAAGAEAPTVGRAPSAPAKVTVLSKNDVLILIRTTLIALSQANTTGNYTLLHDLGSPEFQAKNTAATLGDIFRPLRAQPFDLSGVTVLEPQLTLLPEIEPGGQLHLSGFFPSVPLQIRFDMLFAPRDQRWALSSLTVSLMSAAPGPMSAVRTP